MSNTISQNLTRLQNAQTNIKNAILDKGGTVGLNDGFEEFSADINTIPTSSPTFAFLYVTTESGVTITVSKGGTILDSQTATSQNLQLCFDIPESGTWTVSGTNNMSTTISITNKGVYYIELIQTHIYGATIPYGKTATRTDESSLFSDPNPYYSGMSGSPSSPFDNLMPWSGMTVETFEDGNVMVKIPKFYYKITKDAFSISLKIADRYVEGFSVSPAHQARNENEVDRDYVYIGRYKCTGTNYKSISGLYPKTSQSRPNMRTGCRQQGTGSNVQGYYPQDFAMWWTIRFLYLVEFASYNSQEKIGYGCGDGSGLSYTGYSDSLQYHTGTTQSERTTFGASVQYRNIEGLWDNCLEWIDGIYFGSTNYRTIYIIKDPNNFATSSGVAVGTRQNSNYFEIGSFITPSNSDYDWAMYPATGSAGLGDDCLYDSSCSYLSTGGYYSQYGSYGLFYCDDATSSSKSYIGTRLMYLPPQ